MPTVFLNGRFVDGDEARVSAFDAGLLHGVGLFETMIARTSGRGAEAVVHRLAEHIERLIGSARALGLSESLRPDPLAEAVVRTVERSGHARARVRLTVTGGDLNLLRRDPEGAREGGGAIDPTVLISAEPATEYPAEMFERGVGVTIADTRPSPLDPMAGHKTLNYWGRLRELRAAAAKRAGEALMLSATNHLAGGCVSNVFLVKGGALLTPIARGEEGPEGKPPRRGGEPSRGVYMRSPVLPGVTRREVLDIAGAMGIACTARMLAIDDLLGADEVFLTNSSWGVLPVVKVEREAIGDGVVGEVTRRVREAWGRAVA